MEVVDENAMRNEGSSPAKGKASRRVSNVSPLAELARDAQGMDSPRGQAASARGEKGINSGSNAQGRSLAGGKGASKRAKLAAGAGATSNTHGGSRKGGNTSRRLTADKMALADVLQSLASPKGSKRAGGNETAEEPATPSARNGHKLGHKRRDTADFSIINSLLDESTASSTALHADNASDQLHAVAAKGRQGEETADFSSLMTLVQNGLTETETPPRDDGAKPSARPRARRHSNQKPGRDGQGARLAAPPSVPLGGPARVGEGGSAGSGSSGDVGGGGGKVSRPVSAKPKPPARRPRRSINLDPSRTPAASWEDYAVPTPEADPLKGLVPPERPSPQPMSNAAAAAPGSSSEKGVRNNYGGDDSVGGETGDVGDLLAELSVNDDLDAVSSRGGAGEVQPGSARDQRQDEVIEVGKAVIEVEGGGGGVKTMSSKERSSRRCTAEKLTVESLLGSLDSPSPVMTVTEIGEAASGWGEDGDGEASNGQRDDSDTDEDSDDSGDDGGGAGFAGHDARWDAEERTGGQAVRMLDADETPESSARKKLKRSSRRETADFTDVQDLLNTPDSTTPPATSNSVDVDAKGAVRYPSGVELAGNGVAGGHASEQSPTLGGAGGEADSLPRKGSYSVDERRNSEETASVPELLGLFDRSTEDTSARYEVDGSTLDVEGRASTPRDGVAGGSGRGGGGGRLLDRRESVGASSVGSVLGLLECTPSPGGGLDQSVADGSALRGKTLARLYDDADGNGPDSPAEERRLTCGRHDFEDVIGDLASPSAPSSACSGDDDSPGMGEDGKGRLSPPSMEEGSNASSTPASIASSRGSSSFSMNSPNDQRTPEQGGNAASAAAVKADEFVFSSPNMKSTKTRKDDRRSTASPSTLDMLMRDLDEDDDEMEARNGQDRRGTAESLEVQPPSSGESDAPSPVDAPPETPSPVMSTPSPPVARRTRSKSPLSATKNNGGRKPGDKDKVDVGFASPRAAPKRRASESVAMSPGPKLPATSRPAPESARGRLKSCLSSRKRVRGADSVGVGGGGRGGASSVSDGASLFTPSNAKGGGGDADGAGGAPESRTNRWRSPPSRLAARPSSSAAEVETPGAAGGVAVGGGAGAGAGGVGVSGGLETPRRVMFGAPMAAEFNHSSPSNRLTPMPSRDAKSLFPLEKGPEDDTDEDEDTAANSAQLAEWDGVAPALDDGEYAGFDSINHSDDDDDGHDVAVAEERKEKQKGGEDRGATSIAAFTSPSRNRRRDSLALKSPLRRSIAEFSEGVRAMGGDMYPSPYDSDDDSTSRAIDNLNASISGPAARASADAAAAPAGAGDPQNMSFTINTRQMRGLEDSDSSMELTGNFTINPQPMSARAVAGGAAAAATPLGGGSPTSLSMPAAGAETRDEVDGKGNRRGDGNDKDDDSRMDLNDSSELAYTLCGSSIRDAVSPGSRRVSSGSLLDVMDEVGEYEQEVLLQAKASSGEERRAGGGDGKDEDGDAQEIVSPSVPGGVPREEASHPDSADMSLDDDHDTDSDGAEDGVKGESARLATVREELSPSGHSCPSPTISLDRGIDEIDGLLAEAAEKAASKREASPIEISPSRPPSQSPSGRPCPSPTVSLDRALDELGGEMAEVAKEAASMRETSPVEMLRGGGGGRAVGRPGSLGGSPTDHTVALGVDFAEELGDIEGSLGGSGSAGLLPPSTTQFRPLVFERVGGGKPVSRAVELSPGAAGLRYGGSRGGGRGAGGGGGGGASSEGSGGCERRREHAREGVPLDSVALAAGGGGRGVGLYRRDRRSSIADVEMEIEEGSDAVVAGTDDIDGAPGCSDSDEVMGGKHLEERLAGERLRGATGGTHTAVREQELPTMPGTMAVAEAAASAVTRGTNSPRDGSDGAHAVSGVGRVEEDAVESAGEGSLSSAVPGSVPDVSATAAAAVGPPAYRRASSFSTQGKLLKGGRRRASLQSIMGTARQALNTRSISAAATMATAVGGEAEDEEEVAAAAATAVSEGVAQPGDSSAPSPPSQQQKQQLPCSPSSSPAAATAAAAAAALTGGGAPASRPPLHRISRRASSSSLAFGNASGEGNRRASLQEVIGARPRRTSIAPACRDVGPSQSEASSLRKRLSAGATEPAAVEVEVEGVTIGVSGEEGSGAVGVDSTTAGAEGVGEAEGGRGGKSGVGMEVGVEAEPAHEMDGSEEEEEEEEDTPLAMTIEDLMAFVAPGVADGATSEDQTIPSMVVSRGGLLSGECLGGMPDGLVHAMTATLNAAAAEMEDKVPVHQEHASATADAAWKFHTDAPVLGEIDRAIAQGGAAAAGGDAAEGMPFRVREMAGLIKSRLEREWAAWEVDVLERVAYDAEEVLSRVSRSREAYTKRGDELDEMVENLQLAENTVKRHRSRDELRGRMEKGDEKLRLVDSEVSEAEKEIETLKLQQEELAAKKASLVERQAQREAKTKAAAKRSASVVRLMELESKGIRLERDALCLKEKLDVQLGLSLWCQPVTLLPDRVVVAFAAPHDRTLKHELKFEVDENSGVSASSAEAPREKGGMSVPKGAVVPVGGEDSASGQLSRLFFEGKGGLFSTGEEVGAAVSGLASVKTVAGLKAEVQKAEWFVGRAYALLQEVHDVEKKHASTVTSHHTGGAATLCVEVADWRARRTLRLKFRVAPTFACCVGGPMVEVDVGNLDVSVVEEAIRVAGGDRAGLTSVTKAVRAAASCISA